MTPPRPAELPPRRRRLGAMLFVFVVLLAGSAWSAERWVPSTVPMVESRKQVIVFGAAPLGFDDLEVGRTPNLDAVLREGAVAAMSTRTGVRRSTPEEGYLSLGAGYRLRAVTGQDLAYAADERVGAQVTGADVYEAVAEQPLDGAVGVVGAVEAAGRYESRSIASRPGALGQALAEAGLVASVVTNADERDPVSGHVVPKRPAALAVMDASMQVAHGQVAGSSLLIEDPAGPFGWWADPDAFAVGLERAAATSDVVVVDSGDLARAHAASRGLEVDARAAMRAEALARTDALLGRALDLADEDTVVLVVSVAGPGPGFHVTPLAAVGGGVAPGYLVSPSVKRTGIAAVTDLAPTILELTGVPVPASMPGNAIQVEPGPTDLTRLRDLDRDTVFRERTYGGWVVGFINAHLVLYGVALVVILAGWRQRSLVGLLRLGALLLAGFPLATLLFRLVPDGAELGGRALWVVLGIDLAVAVAALQLRRHPLLPLQAIVAATVAVILVDAVSGTRLHVNAWLGYSLHGGGRFYGIPNTTYALLAAGGLLTAAALVHHATRRKEGLFAAALVLALVVVVDGAPNMGGDVGGIVSLIPVFAAVLLVLARHRITPRSVLLITVGTLAALALAIGVDLLRPPAVRTHLGRWAATVAEDGVSTVVDTFVRKQSANLAIFQTSFWARMLPITGVFLGVLLWSRQRRAAIVPRGSAITIGVVGTLVGALVGFLANDSGPIVLGLFFTFLLPVVLVTALAARPGASGADEDAGASALPPADPVAGRAPDGAEPDTVLAT